MFTVFINIYFIVQEEWRIQMLPIKFFFLTACPVVVMRIRCKSNGQDYPSDVPLDITKVLELNMVRLSHESQSHKPDFCLFNL